MEIKNTMFGDFYDVTGVCGLRIHSCLSPFPPSLSLRSCRTLDKLWFSFRLPICEMWKICSMGLLWRWGEVMSTKCLDSTAHGAQFPPTIALPPDLSGCCTECSSLIQSGVAPPLAYVLQLGCQLMTDSYSGRSQQGGNWPFSPKDICSGSTRSQGFPMWGFSFTSRPSKRSLWAGKGVSHFSWASWRCFAFCKENWEFLADPVHSHFSASNRLSHTCKQPYPDKPLVSNRRWAITVLDSAERDYFHHLRKFCSTA